jgi:TfoX/Sxy family transcriptional regulator of competence genes
MSTSQGTMDYILDQLSALGTVRARRMFGDYALYCGEKVVGLVCDDQLFIKYTPTGKKHAEGRYTEGYAYEGARPSMNVTDTIDDPEFLCTLIRLTADALPLPKMKKKR